jgi:hypothetical protein
VALLTLRMQSNAAMALHKASLTKGLAAPAAEALNAQY